MKSPKFIITMEGCLRMGMVDQHRDLLLPGDDCIGGGYYTFDYVANRIILDRRSYDFGRPHIGACKSFTSSTTIATISSSARNCKLSMCRFKPYHFS